LSSKKISDELLSAYKNTILDIDFDGRKIDEKELYQIWQSNFYVITASNPKSEELSDVENQSRNKQLHGILANEYDMILNAVGRSPNNSWRENHFIVRTTNESKMIELAQHFEQNAIFRVSEFGKELVLI
jgi:hypothetical protein